MAEKRHDVPTFEETEEQPEYAPKEFDVLAEVVFDPEAQPQPHPKGKPGEVREGFSFFKLIKKKDQAGKEKIEASYIRSRMSDKPTLVSRGEKQFKNWKKKKIVARPVNYTWSEEKGMWSIKEKTSE